MTETQKKTGSPTQPGYRSAGYRSRRHRKPKTIIQRAALFFKRCDRRIIFSVLAGGLLVFFLLRLISGVGGSGATEAADVGASPTEAATEAPADPPAYIFRDGDGCPIDIQQMTNAWAAEAGYEKRYNITDAERWEIASVITAEAVGEPFAGKVAVAQCILQACEDAGIRPIEALARYQYSSRRPEPTEEALEAVAAVFDFGHVVTFEPIKFFYAPELVTSSWHESQVYVLTINNHKFFKEADQ